MDSKEGSFKCNECDNGVNYRRRYNLDQHKASRHHNVTFDCDECDKSYTSKYALNIHKKSQHEGLPAHKCNECNYRRNFGNLREHKRIYHDKIKLKCEKRTYVMFSSPAMRLHKNLHYCVRCEFVTYSKETLQVHCRRLHSMNQLECHMCDFKSSYDLARHKRNSHAEKSKCDSCDFMGNKIQITVHRRKFHENVKYSCSDCHYQAKTQIQINIHKKTNHEGIRYICNTCDLAILSFKSLENHKKNKHEGIRHDCPKCDYKATMRGNLKIHIQAMHERVGYHCNLCSYKASTPRSLKLHEKSKHVI